MKFCLIKYLTTIYVKLLSVATNEAESFCAKIKLLKRGKNLYVLHRKLVITNYY